MAENAGGPRALKYGVTREYVLGLEVVIPTGEILRLGSLATGDDPFWGESPGPAGARRLCPVP